MFFNVTGRSMFLNHRGGRLLREQRPERGVRPSSALPGTAALCTARRGDRVLRPGGRVTQARVDTRRVPGVVGESLQDGGELGTLARVEHGEDLFLVLVGDPAGAGEQLARGLGQVNGVGAAVSGMPPAFDQTALLEVVEQADHDLAVDAQRVGELLLGDPFATLEVRQEPEMVRRDAQRCQPRGERLRDVKPELGQQEVGPTGQRPVRARCGVVRHPGIVPLRNCPLR